MENDSRRLDGGASDPGSLPVAVRVFTTRRSHSRWRSPATDRPKRASRQAARRDYPHEALIFDTETLPGPAQNPRILVWRLYRDRSGGTPGKTCIEEGIAYPDDLESTNPKDFQLLVDYVAAKEAGTSPGFPVRLFLEPVSWWLEERLFRYGYANRDRCSIVGFNLLFDLGRLARYWTNA